MRRTPFIVVLPAGERKLCRCTCPLSVVRGPLQLTRWTTDNGPMPDRIIPNLPSFHVTSSGSRQSSPKTAKVPRRRRSITMLTIVAVLPAGDRLPPRIMHGGRRCKRFYGSCRRGFVCGIGLLMMAGSTGCQVDVGGQTLPSAYYTKDDVQYFPPGPGSSCRARPRRRSSMRRKRRSGRRSRRSGFQPDCQARKTDLPGSQAGKPYVLEVPPSSCESSDADSTAKKLVVRRLGLAPRLGDVRRLPVGADFDARPGAVLPEGRVAILSHATQEGIHVFGRGRGFQSPIRSRRSRRRNQIEFGRAQHPRFCRMFAGARVRSVARGTGGDNCRRTLGGRHPSHSRFVRREFLHTFRGSALSQPSDKHCYAGERLTGTNDE